jgi:hypothetical protein
MYVTIRDWIVAVTGYPVENVYREHQEGPRKSGGHATYKVITGRTTMHPIIEREDYGADDDVLKTFSHFGQLWVSVNIYALDGYDKLDDLALSNNDYEIRQILTNGAGLELIRMRGESQDLTGLKDTEHKQRYRATYEFNRFKTSTERNQKVLEVAVSGTVNGDDETAYYPPL